MAIVSFPPGSPTPQKSYSGATFTQNGSGFIIRKKVKPLYKLNPRNSIPRANFRNVQSNYRNQSPGEKSAWTTKSPQFPRVNSLGQAYTLQGNQLYAGLNQNRVNSDLAINTTAPDAAVFPMRSITSFLMDVNPVDLSMQLSSNLVPPDFNFDFWSSDIYSVERALSFPQDYKLIQTFAPATYPFFDISLAWQAIFGPGPSFDNIPPDVAFLSIVLMAFYIPSGEVQPLDTIFTSFAG